MNARLEILVGNEWRPVLRLGKGPLLHGNSPTFAPVPEVAKDDLWRMAIDSLVQVGGEPVVIETAAQHGTETVLFGSGAAGPMRLGWISEES
ncbi:hypothetical protein [Streptomyces sp. NBC_01358]|uniref:hypothetical protein n=1 Tax=Streptomyces sp. NBC_01358 TaxID=2903837 RepID=UPI002E31F09E|nr:hypothetical protein [Streptomyces sp. NBC_01358]